MAEEMLDTLEERIAYLSRKIEREGLRVPFEVVEYIAERGRTAQGLKGALLKVHALASIHRREIDLSLARNALEGIAEELAGEPEEPADTTAAQVPASAPVAPAVTDDDVDGTQPAAERSLESEIADVLFPAELPEVVYESQAPAATTAPAPAPAAPATAPTAPTPAAAPAAPAPAAPTLFSPGPAVQPAPAPAPSRPHARVFFAPVRTSGKKSLVSRTGTLLERAGLASAIDEGDLVAVKLHFGEQGNTGFVQPIYVREVVQRIKAAGGRPFLTDANTLYRGQRANAVDHLECALHNGFSYATVEAPLVIADGLDGREAVDVAIPGGRHFDAVRLGAAAVHADAMVVISHVKGHEATGFGGALKNVGMGLGCRSAKQRMHADFRPEVTGEKCTACGRCVQWCPVDAIAIGPDRVAHVDYEVCYGCGECVAACPYGAIATQWKTTPEAIQEKIVEHAAGALLGKEDKIVYVSFVTNVSPDCDCWHFSDASVVPDIGVLASSDIVAVEQAAYDLVTAAVGLPGTHGEGLAAGTDKFTAITGIDGTRAIEYAEELGLGTRRYDLVEIG